MNPFKNITIVGAGNVATHLAQALKKQGFIVPFVYSRTLESAKILANRIGAQPVNSFKDILNTDGTIIFAVKDDAIEELLKRGKFENRILIHTAGSVDMNIFQNYSENYGIIYPLQTFSKSKELNFNEVPLCIEASNMDTHETISNISNKLSSKVYNVNSEQRKQLHLAAVFACNFTNHMYHIASNIVESKGLDFEILKPLIKETAQKINNMLPLETQTGPATREDYEVINSHQELLKEDKTYSDIYKILTESIIKQKKRPDRF